MSATAQGVRTDRYTLIPRTAVFLRRGDAFLLLKGSPGKRIWPGRYNGIGGHVERGEDALTAARRELREETGLDADLWLCGTVIVDSGPVGIGLFVFSGEVTGGQLRESAEGMAEWVPFDQIRLLPAVADVPHLTARILTMQRGNAPFSARSRYAEQDRLVLEFVD